MDDSLTILAGNHSASTTLNTYPQGNSSNVTAVISPYISRIGPEKAALFGIKRLTRNV